MATSSRSPAPASSRLAPRALAAAGFAVALVAVGAPVAADPVGDQAYGLYDDQWRHAVDFAACGWQTVDYGLGQAGQTSQIPEGGEAATRSAAGSVFAPVRGPTDPIVYGAAQSVVPTAEGAVVAARSYGEAAKCLVFHYAIHYADALVWFNEPVACFAKSTIACGIPCLVYDAQYPAFVGIWALGGAGGPPPTPCLPPGQLNCVPPQTIGRCMPPPLP